MSIKHIFKSKSVVRKGIRGITLFNAKSTLEVKIVAKRFLFWLSKMNTRIASYIESLSELRTICGTPHTTPGFVQALWDFVERLWTQAEWIVRLDETGFKNAITVTGELEDLQVLMFDTFTKAKRFMSLWQQTSEFPAVEDWIFSRMETK